MLDVHVLESISILLTQKLIEQCFLEVNSLDVKEGGHAVHMASVADHMVNVSPFVI